MKRLPFADEAAWRTHAGTAARHLADDGLVGYPTETVYGLGCAVAPAPLLALARLKRTGVDRPFLLLASRLEQLPRLRWTAAATRLADAFWPGPLTLVLAADEELPQQVRAADGTVAVRLSPHPAVRALVGALDAPITSTSANPPGGAPARTGVELAAAVAEIGGGPEWLLLDGGVLPASPPSTLVRCVDADVRVLRSGAIADDELRTALGETDARA